MTDHIVLFAYHFPPENAIGGVRPFRFYKYLSEMGYRCHIITAADQSSRPDLDVTYVPDPFVERPRQGMGWQIERAARKFLLPGVTGIQWSYPACRAGRKLAGANPNARITIFSTYPPLGTHLAAWRLAKTARLPWIADFRDPLGDNPGHGDILPIQREFYRQLERMVFGAADIAIANTDAVAEQWKARYNRHRARIHLIWNGYDPEERIRPLPLPQRDYRLLTHVGELYEGRKITALLESFARLIDSGRLTAERVRIKLVGSARHDSIPSPDFMDRARAAGWLEVVPRIPQKEALQLSQTSEGLLLVQPHSTVQVPGKLYEYVQIGRPVLAFILPNTPIERILDKSGVRYTCVYADGTQEAMDDAVMKFCQLPTEAVAASAWFEENFDARKQTRTLEGLIRSLHPE